MTHSAGLDYGSAADLPSWSLGKNLCRDLNSLFSLSSFGLLFDDFRFTLSLSPLRVDIVGKNLFLLVSPDPGLDMRDNMNTRHHSPSQTPRSNLQDQIAGGKFLGRFIRFALRILRRFLRVRIEQTTLAFTNFPKSAIRIDYWLVVEMQIDNMNFFDDAQSIFSMDSLSIMEFHVDCRNWNGRDEIKPKILVNRNVLELPKLSFTESCLISPSHIYSPGSEWRLTVGRVLVNLWPTTLLLFTSAFGGDSRSSNLQKPLHPDGAIEEAIKKFKSLLFPHRQYIAIISGGFDVSIHLPLSRPENLRFASMAFYIDDLKLYAHMDPASDLPLFLATSPKFRMSAIGAAEIGSENLSRLQNLFEEYWGSPSGTMQDLLLGFRATASNCWLSSEILDSVDLLDDQSIQSWIQTVAMREPLWGIQNVSESKMGKQYAETMDQVKKIPTDLYGKFVTSRNPLSEELFRILPKTIALRLHHLSFDVPFEFPLANLFDHFVLFIKCVKVPLSRKGDRQDFNFFDWTWRLLVMGNYGRFSVADGPFESSLARYFRIRRELQDRFDNIESLFWDRCRREAKEYQDAMDLDIDDNRQKETKKAPETKGSLDPNEKTRQDTIMSNRTPEEIKACEEIVRKHRDHRIPPMRARYLMPLNNASMEPDLLLKSPFLVSRYLKLQESLFSCYREKHKEYVDAYSDGPPSLFNLSARDVNLIIRWNPKYLQSATNNHSSATIGMSDLLNAMEMDESFKEDEVSEFGFFMGGFIDVSGHDLNIVLRDYAAPLTKARSLRINGLLFLVEEASYPNAQATNFVALTHPGSNNLRGVPIDGRVTIHRTILPTKIYHSLNLSIFGEEPAVIGFSPLYEGSFQMLDRAFELFSKRSEEPSPFLPFWDKIRLLMRGACSTASLTCPARIVCLAGKNLNSYAENLELVFPRGFRMGLAGSEVHLQVPEAAIFINSEQESILRWLHATTGSAFSRTEKELLGPTWRSDLLGQIPMITFPRCHLKLTFDIRGINDKPPCSHSVVRVCVAGRVPKGRKPTTLDPDKTHLRRVGSHLLTEYDSFREFRTHSMGILLQATAPGNHKDNHLMWYYFRELEGWIRRNFADYIRPPVKPGKLFRFGALSKTINPKLSSVLNEFRFAITYDGFFCARLLQYYDAARYGGALLTSTGRSRIWLNYKRSDHRAPENQHHGRWYGHFMEVDFSNVKLGVITSDTKADQNLRTGVPFSYEGAAIFTILSAPRLFWIAINEDAFAHDPDGQKIQRRCLESRTGELKKEIEALTVKFQKLDPLTDPKKFADCRHELSVLVEQQTHIDRFLNPMTEDPEKYRGINNHQYIIQNARLIWHQDARDAVFAFIDQQFQFYRCSNSLPTKILSIFNSLMHEMSMPVNAQFGLASNPASPNTPTAAQFGDLPSAGSTNGMGFVESLLCQNYPFEAGPESPDNEDVTEFSLRDMPDPIKLTDVGFHVATKIDFTLVQPQMVLLDTSSAGKMEAAVTVNAKDASVKYGTLVELDGKERIGRRTKISFEQAQVHVAFKAEFEDWEWPPRYPSEYLLTKETEGSRFHRVSQRLRLTILYDVASPFYNFRNASPAIKRIFPNRGDRILAESSGIEVMSTSQQYAVVYDILINLLAYRDPTQKMRHNQLESIMLASNIFDPEQIVELAKQNQDQVKQRKNRITRKLSLALDRGTSLDSDDLIGSYTVLKGSWDSLALIVDALRTLRANQEKLKQRQSRLLLEVILGKIQWTLLLGSTFSPLAEMILHNNRVNWLSSEDGSQSTLIEIQTILALNRLPKAFYRTLVAPVPPDQLSQLSSAQEGFRGIGTLNNSLRFYAKVLPPVGGIRIIEHAELNLAPLQFQLTYNIAEELIKFFFPEKPHQAKETEANGGRRDNRRKTAFSQSVPDLRVSALLGGPANAFTVPEFSESASVSDDGIHSSGVVSVNLHGPVTEPPPPTCAPSTEIPPAKEKPLSRTRSSSTLISRAVSLLRRHPTRALTSSNTDGPASGATEAETDSEEISRAEMMLRGLTSSIQTTASSFFSHFNDQLVDDHDIELMKARAADNYSFIYVTVPASQHLVSYKGRWRTNITDVENFVLKLPDFEYHTHIWSWLELALQLRRDSVSVVANNVGALLKDKLRRLGQTNKPEGESEYLQGSSGLAEGPPEGINPADSLATGLSRAASRLHRPKRPDMDEEIESSELKDEKARLVLGRSFIRPE